MWILDALKKEHDTHVVTGLHAAARLGVEEALPRITEIASNHWAEYVRRHAVVSQARLRAELAVAGLADSPQRADTKSKRFLTELNLDVAKINSAVAAFNPPRLSDDPWPIEKYALREVADMVYQSYSDYKDLPEVKALDFSRDYGASLKVRLAPMSKAARISTMIDELALLTGVGADPQRKMQLVIDEGTDASKAAAVKLREMGNDRRSYKPSGFEALFQVICGLGDTEQAAIVERFLDDPDPAIRSDARFTHPLIVAGHKFQFAAGF